MSQIGGNAVRDIHHGMNTRERRQLLAKLHPRYWEIVTTNQDFFISAAGGVAAWTSDVILGLFCIRRYIFQHLQQHLAAS